jgi:predicted small lipoprotein YifL
MIPHSAHAALALLVLSLAACGQKGPLYMPDTTQGEVVTRPASTDAATGTSNSPASPDSPGRATSPTPEVTAPQSEADKKKNGSQPPPK